jgi:carbon-monoxide dehydrogenase medium subunit
MGTIGGNLAFGEPHADPPTLLEALGARIVLAGEDSVRKLLVEEFLIGAYETALDGHEVLVRIEIPLPGPKVSIVYEKFQILERPTIGVAACATLDDEIFQGPPVIVVGSVGEKPTRIPTDDLDGKSVFDEEALTGVGRIAADVVDPVEDLSGGEEYKRHLTRTFVQRTLRRISQSKSRS